MEKYSEEHYNLIANFDRGTFSQWRQKNQKVQLNLAGADLSNKIIGYNYQSPDKISIFPANFEGAILENTQFLCCDLSNVNFTNAQLRSSKFLYSFLEKAVFFNTNLESADFSNSQLINVNFSSACIKNTTIKCESNCDFTNAQLDKVTFTGINDCKFINIKGKNLTFSFTNCQNNDFSDSMLLSSNFTGSHSISIFTQISKNNFSNADLSNSTFAQTRFSSCIFKNSNLSNVIVDQETKFSGTDFTKANFYNSSLKDGHFKDSNFEDADFTNCHLIKTKFELCKFIKSNLNQIKIEKEVSFESVDFENAIISRYMLECIPEEQIPKYARLKMNIEDDLAKLKQYYSGYYRFLNGILLILFLAPYIKFTLLRWVEAKFYTTDPNTITLLGAICRFIVSGGKSWQLEWQFDYLAITVFLITLFYNAFRTALLLKTISLEHQQEIRGLPIKFSIKDSPFLEWVISWNYWLFSINLVAVIIHTINFLLQRVNVGNG